jgi:TetR/AcrR family acrAB operon transcriptional repressor
MRKTKEEAAITREKVLDAALTVFSRKGYAASTLDDVAQEANMTRGAIYWHFRGKAELLLALAEERFARAYAGFAEILEQHGTPLETLRRLMRWSLEYVEDDPQYRAVLELTLFKLEATPELEEGMRQKVQNMTLLVQQFQNLIQSAVEAGEVRADVDPYTAALGTVAFTNGLISLWLLNPAGFSIKAQAPQAVELFLHGLKP